MLEQLASALLVNSCHRTTAGSEVMQEPDLYSTLLLLMHFRLQTSLLNRKVWCEKPTEWRGLQRETGRIPKILQQTIPPPQPYNTAWFQPCHYSSRDHHSWIGAKPLILTKPYQAHLANTKTFMKTLNSSHPYKMSLKTLRQALLKTLIPLKIMNTFWHLHPLIYQDWTSDITTY